MKTEQLDFLGKFDRDSKQDEQAVKLILDIIPNVKYLRSRIRFCTEEIPSKDAALTHVQNILYNIATIAWKKSRWISQYKYEHLTYFLDLTLDSRVLNCTEVITLEEVQGYVKSVGERTIAVLKGVKAVLKAEQKNIDTITAEFKSLQYLLK